MDVLYSHLSTLFQLWTSLDVDSFTIHKKLDIIIKDVERLIHNERKEKQLLSANIEDLMSNIEYASSLLGVSLENILNTTTTATNKASTLKLQKQIELNSFEITSIHTALQPSYAKEKILFELNSRLIKEINVRSQHLFEWLNTIQSLCKELDQPFKFKSIEDYIQSDLSWATVQSVSCELRDLTELKAARLLQFNTSMKSLQYYWKLLDYSSESVTDDDNSIKNISQLLDQYTVNYNVTITIPSIKGEDEEQENDIIEVVTDFYNHPANPFTTLSTELITVLEKKSDTLKTLYTERYNQFIQTTTKLKAVWDELNLPILERPSLPSTLAKKDMMYLQELIDGLEPLIRSTFDKFILKFKDQLTSLWDDCLLSEIERNDFITSLYQQNSRAEIEHMVNTHIANLSKIHIEGKQLQKLMQERKDLIQKMIDFEKTASDPRRLFQASFQLLEEERWRNTCLPRLLQLDERLIEAVVEYERLANKPILCAGGTQRYLNTLLDEIADREANQTFFGFLNSDPVPSHQQQQQQPSIVTHKRGNGNNNKAKSRPASASSLNAVVQQQSSFLKTKVKSAMLQFSASTKATTDTALLQPSQSVPLNHPQNSTKKRMILAQKRQLTASPPHSDKGQHPTTASTRPQRTATNKKIKTSFVEQMSEEESSIRYSRLNLTKATTATNKRFGYQYNQKSTSGRTVVAATTAATASLIPIAASRVQLTTAKSM